jgi:hypothetical protein
VECVRWVFAEILRLFVTSSRGDVVAAIEELSRFPQPLIRNYGDKPLLQSVAFTAEEEVLVHLLHARRGMTTPELVKAIPKDPSSVRRAIRGLAQGKKRQAVNVNGHWEITDVGIARIEARILEMKAGAKHTMGVGTHS